MRPSTSTPRRTPRTAPARVQLQTRISRGSPLALVGALLLVFVIFIRPQEFIPVLASMSILNLTTAIAVIGIAIDVGSGKIRSLQTPQLPLLGAFAAWCVISTAIKAGVGEVTGLNTVFFSFIFMLVVCFGTPTFERIRAMGIMLLFVSLSLSAIGSAQAMSPFECIVLEADEDGVVARDASIGASNGMSCETWHDCAKKTNDYKTDFLCEKPGPFDTFSVGGGRVRWRGTLADPNELSLAIGAAMSFAFALHASSKGFLRHLLLIGTIALATYCVVQTASRGGVLVILAVLGTYFVRRYGAKGFVLAAALGSPLLLLGGRSGEEADASALERVGALYEGMTFVKENPFLGLGAGQFVENYFITAHNSYVLSAAELGLPGMVIWTSLVYISMKIPYSIAFYPTPTLDRRLQPYAFALFTSFAGILVGIFFLSFCYHAMLYIYFGLAGAMYLAARRSSPDFEVKITGKEIGMIAAGDVALILVLFVYTRIKGAP